MYNSETRQLINLASESISGDNLGINLRSPLFVLAGRECFLQAELLQDMSQIDYKSKMAMRVSLKALGLSEPVQIEKRFHTQLNPDELGMFEVLLQEELGFPRSLLANSRVMVRNGYEGCGIGSSLLKLGLTYFEQFLKLMTPQLLGRNINSITYEVIAASYDQNKDLGRSDWRIKQMNNDGFDFAGETLRNEKLYRRFIPIED